jgi:hypothetical protein
LPAGGWAQADVDRPALIPKTHGEAPVVAADLVEESGLATIGGAPGALEGTPGDRVDDL